MTAGRSVEQGQNGLRQMTAAPGRDAWGPGEVRRKQLCSGCLWLEPKSWAQSQDGEVVSLAEVPGSETAMGITAWELEKLLTLESAKR